jgi:hypothetical protein
MIIGMGDIRDLPGAADDPRELCSETECRAAEDRDREEMIV